MVEYIEKEIDDVARAEFSAEEPRIIQADGPVTEVEAVQGEMTSENIGSEFWEDTGDVINNLILSGMNCFPLQLHATGLGNAHSGKVPLVPSWIGEDSIERVVLSDPHCAMIIQGGQVYSPSFRTSMKLPSSANLVQQTRRLPEQMTTLLRSDPVVMYLDHDHIKNVILDIKGMTVEMWRNMKTFHSYHQSRSQQQVRFEYFYVFSKDAPVDRWTYPLVPSLGNAIRNVVVASTASNMCGYLDAVIRHVFLPLKTIFSYANPDDLFLHLKKMRESTKTGLLYMAELAAYLVGGLNTTGKLMKTVGQMGVENCCRPPFGVCTKVHPEDVWTRLPFALSPKLLPDWNESGDSTHQLPLTLRMELRKKIRNPKEFFECTDHVRCAALKVCQEMTGQSGPVKYHEDIDYVLLASLPERLRRRFLKDVCKRIVHLYQYNAATILLEKAKRSTTRRNQSPREYAGLADLFSAPTHAEATGLQPGNNGFLNTDSESIRTMGA